MSRKEPCDFCVCAYRDCPTHNSPDGRRECECCRKVRRAQLPHLHTPS
jgi:hypothetical protein